MRNCHPLAVFPALTIVLIILLAGCGSGGAGTQEVFTTDNLNGLVTVTPERFETVGTLGERIPVATSASTITIRSWVSPLSDQSDMDVALAAPPRASLWLARQNYNLGWVDMRPVGASSANVWSLDWHAAGTGLYTVLLSAKTVSGKEFIKPVGTFYLSN